MTPRESVQVLDDPRRAGAVLSPLRRRILENLARPDSAAGLSRRLGVSRQRLNYHLRELERAGFVELAELRQRRGCVERRVRTTARAWLIGPAVLGSLAVDPERIADRLSSAYLVALASRLLGEVSTLRGRAERSGKKLATVSLNTEIEFESPAALAEFTLELSAAVAGLVGKYHREGPQSRRHRLVVGAHPIPDPATDPAIETESSHVASKGQVGRKAGPSDREDPS